MLKRSTRAMRVDFFLQARRVSVDKTKFIV